MNTSISEKEFAVINELSVNYQSNQRNIAKKLGISLGLTNLIIKRLIKMGYLKVVQLNCKKIQYIITPRGFAEKAKKSYNYTLKTVQLLKKIREAINDEIVALVRLGKKNFVVVGDNELAGLVESVIQKLTSDISGIKYMWVDMMADKGQSALNSGVIFLYCETPGSYFDSGNNIDIIEYLSAKGLFL